MRAPRCCASFIGAAAVRGHAADSHLLNGRHSRLHGHADGNHLTPARSLPRRFPIRSRTLHACHGEQPRAQGVYGRHHALLLIRCAGAAEPVAARLTAADTRRYGIVSTQRAPIHHRGRAIAYVLSEVGRTDCQPDPFASISTAFRRAEREVRSVFSHLRLHRPPSGLEFVDMPMRPPAHAQALAGEVDPSSQVYRTTGPSVPRRFATGGHRTRRVSTSVPHERASATAFLLHALLDIAATALQSSTATAACSETIHMRRTSIEHRERTDHRITAPSAGASL